MKNSKPKARPSHRIFSVSEEENPTWTEIGAAWPHSDGQGFNLTFRALPMPGTKMVLRVPKASGEADFAA